ncbi:hypothetical protein Poli38472_007089 [Pythium oligandrum]|uniref:Uncharacterized protein n=1 Tax=Pythium oligandrum TaxID=41045 RepID=A0A8K1C932_PYTOL|nr:hypothetical protein Poli38472_007089 [Pythium oligandrum]|eukprot:TMW58944.1 hypothetical protein Poli38472_007089 [Pythium oligandrum]
MTEPEFKRLRHRRYVKKSYDKQMNRTRRLREELVTLETQYNEMLRRQVEGTVTRMPLLQKYIEITRLKDRLYEENLALQQYNGEFMIVESRLQGIFDTEAEPPVADMKFSFSPLPNAEYARVIASSREYIAKFMQSEGKMTTGVQVLGWEDQKQVRGDRLTFALRKQFAFSAFELLKRTWAIVSSADEFPKIYNPALNTTMHVLQRINEDTVLFYRSVKADNSDVAAKTVFLLARVKVEHGYLLVFRSIDKDLIAFEENGINKVIEEIQAAGESKKTVDVWVEKFVWIIIYENGERTSEFHFGGTASSKLWFKEVLFMRHVSETSAAMTTEEIRKMKRRCRQRKYVKQAYDRQKETLRLLREEVAMLEAQHLVVLRKRKATSSDASIDEGIASRCQLLADEYCQTLRIKDALYREHTALYEANTKSVILGAHVQQLLDTRSLMDESDSLAILPDAEHMRAIQEVEVYAMHSFREAHKPRASDWALGWTHHSKVHGQHLEYKIQKALKGYSASDVEQRSWSFLTNPSNYPKLYSTSLNPSVRLLRRLDDNKVLYFWQVDTPAGRLWSVFLLARVEIDCGYLHIFRTVDKYRDQVVSCGLFANAHATGQWIDQFSWAIVSDAGSGDICHFHFSGLGSPVWFLEVLFMAMRWENYVIQPTSFLCTPTCPCDS